MKLSAIGLVSLGLSTMMVAARPTGSRKDNTQTHTFTVPLDHNDASNKNTIDIRYWIDASNYKPGGAVIMVPNGEATASGDDASFIFGPPLATVAKSLNAAMVLLEHRYYGESHPSLSLPTDYSFLTVNQSLADMATFIQLAKNGLPGISQDLSAPKTKWITRGGSYPGMLAAWMRLAYPDLVFAAVSSSAPVEAQMNFFEYNNAFVQYGPQDCVAAIHNVVDAVDGFLSSNPTDQEKAQFKSQFGVDASVDDKTFASDVPSILIFQWQSTTPKSMPVADACKSAFQGATDPQEQFQNYAEYYKSYNNQKNSKNSKNGGNGVGIGSSAEQRAVNKHHHHRFTSTKQKQQKSDNPYTDDTLWFWQTCREFGFDETVAPPADSPWYNKRVMTNLTTTQDYLDQCQQQFKGQAPAQPSIDAIDNAYSGWSVNLTNTIFVNGEWDPWRWLSVASPDAPKRTNSSTQYFVTLPHGVHCFDYFNYPGYQNSIKTFTSFTAATLKGWVQGA
ncbi:peptidase S28 [Gongronella butleri]|nr:peptidase S28 [Gongronella butleri]